MQSDCSHCTSIHVVWIECLRTKSLSLLLTLSHTHRLMHTQQTNYMTTLLKCKEKHRIISGNLLPTLLLIVALVIVACYLSHSIVLWLFINYTECQRRYWNWLAEKPVMWFPWQWFVGFCLSFHLFNNSLALCLVHCSKTQLIQSWADRASFCTNADPLSKVISDILTLPCPPHIHHCLPIGQSFFFITSPRHSDLHCAPLRLEWRTMSQRPPTNCVVTSITVHSLFTLHLLQISCSSLLASCFIQMISSWVATGSSVTFGSE